MHFTRLFFAALLSLALFSCKDKKKSVYEGCCGAEATSDVVLVTTMLYDDHGNLVDTTVQTHVYIPNLFTNDNDGENDVFMVFGGPYTIKKVVSMECYSPDGSLFFHQENFQPNDNGHSWDGIKPDGTPHQGRFEYEVTIEFVDGQVKTYTGQACAYQCGSAGFPDENLPDCFVPAQNNGNGGVDPTLPLQSDCFEH